MSRPGRVAETNGLGAEARALVAATWAFRTRAERESTLRFARLAKELAAVGAESVVVELARKSSHDEHRHSQLCAAICRLYDGTPPDAQVHDHPAPWPGLAPRDRALYEVVAFGCIAETINAQLLATILDRATAIRIRRVVRRLMKDEVQHSRFGWAHLAAERQRGFGDFLSSVVPSMLASSVDEELFAKGPDPVDAEAVEHGELPRKDRVELFASALRDVILPGFDMFNIDTRSAREWLERRLAAPATTPSPP